MDDVRRADFQRDREADRRRCDRGLLRIGSRAGERLRNLVGGEYGSSFFGFEPAGAAGESILNNLSNSTGIRLERIGASRR